MVFLSVFVAFALGSEHLMNQLRPPRQQSNHCGLRESWRRRRRRH
jgi:hypothetical protein